MYRRLRDDVPLLLNLDDGCRIEQGAMNSIVIHYPDPKFALTLVLGPHRGSHSVPKGYTPVDSMSLNTPFGESEILVAEGAALQPATVVMHAVAASVEGAVLGLVVYWILSVTGANLGWALGSIAGAFLVRFAWRLIKAEPKIKYAVVVEGVEYVFTGPRRHRGISDNIMRAMRYRPC